MSNVAVVTDAASAEHFLPLWVDYYGQQFGREHLYVLCYGDDISARKLGIGHLLPVDAVYNNAVRTLLINDLVEKLLQHYACVIRSDVDEFVTADPAAFPDLAHFVAEAHAPYITAQGLDVVELADEAPLDMTARPLLAQRRFAVKASAYSKTCLVRRPVRWGFGFHTIDAPPAFGDLYLFHLKFADAARRVAWIDHMAEACRGDEAHRAHFLAAGREFSQTLDAFRALPRRDGPAALRDRAFTARLAAAAQRGEDGQYGYPGLPATDTALSAIPENFRRLF